MPEKGHLILCVDDESVGLHIRRLLLERSGYKVVTARDGGAGLASFRSEPIEAVGRDYALPGMHGGEVAARMRAEKPEVPIVLLSAFVGVPEEVIETVDIYMTKGEGAPALLDKLDSLFGAFLPKQGT